MSEHQASALDVVRRTRPGGIEVAVERMEYAGGARTFRVYATVAQWNPEGPPGNGRHEVDYYECDELDLAQAVMEEGETRLLAGKSPDLAAAATRLKRRHRGAATAVRRAHGGLLLMGDTPPDELPRAS